MFNPLGGFPTDDPWSGPYGPSDPSESGDSEPRILGSTPQVMLRGPNTGATVHDHSTGAKYRVPDGMTFEETQDILEVLEPQMQTQRLVKLVDDLVSVQTRIQWLTGDGKNRARDNVFDALSLVSARLLKSLEQESGGKADDKQQS